MPAVAEKLLTATEFARLPNPTDGSRQELVRGEIVTMPPPGFIHGKVQAKVAAQLLTFVDEHSLGHVVTETGCRTERHPDSMRGPDVAFWSFARLQLDAVTYGYPKEPADLCVEVRSADDSRIELREKAQEYLRAGVRMVWVVDPMEITVTVYKQLGRGDELDASQVLSGEEILNGFLCPVASFFAGVLTPKKKKR